jgi:hypothetical protein
MPKCCKLCYHDLQQSIASKWSAKHAYNRLDISIKQHDTVCCRCHLLHQMSNRTSPQQFQTAVNERSGRTVLENCGQEECNASQVRSPARQESSFYLPSSTSYGRCSNGQKHTMTVFGYRARRWVLAHPESRCQTLTAKFEWCWAGKFKANYCLLLNYEVP